MRFADELRGSEGERCVVTTLDEQRHEGVIEAWDDALKIASVRLADGDRVQASYRSIELLDDET